MKSKDTGSTEAILYEVHSANGPTLDDTDMTKLAVLADASLADTETGKTLLFQLKNGLDLSFAEGSEGFDLKLLGRQPARRRPYRARSTKLTLIGHTEDTPSFAREIERRLHGLRQVYAVLVIAYKVTYEAAVYEASAVASCNDLEELLDSDEQLILERAGQGSFWIAAKALGGKAVEVTKKAPGAALRVVSLLYSEGRDLGLRSVRAKTAMTEEEAKQSAIVTKQNEGLTDAAIKKANAEAETAEIAAAFAGRMADLSVQDRIIEQQDKKLQGILQSAKVIDELKDGPLKESLRAAFEQGLASSVLAAPSQPMLPPPESKT